MNEIEHWHVTLTLAGEEWPEGAVRAAMSRLLDEHPFLESCEYDADTAEIRYWEQADSLHDAAALALRMWGEHRRSAGLPPWQVVGLEVVDRRTYRRRETAPRSRSVMYAVGELRRLSV
jgi:hypothetical protein